MKKILIVEDNLQDLTKIKEALRSNDLEIYSAPNIETALKILRDNIIDILVLDRMLINKEFKNEDGITVCQLIKQNPKKYRNPHIIILSKLANFSDKKEGFSAGANSYFDKKSEFDVCVAAIKTELKTKIFKNNIIIYGYLVLNIENCEVKLNEKDLKLDNTEYVILLELLKHQGMWIKAEELKKICWGQKNNVTNNGLYTNVCRLRTKIKEVDDNLISKRYQGYFLKMLN